MLVPNSQACANQFSSTTPIPAATLAKRRARSDAIAAAVTRAQVASDALAVSNPWEFWKGGMNLMKDVARSNLRFSTSPNPGPLQLPGLPAANVGSHAVSNAGPMGAAVRPVPGSPFLNWLRSLSAGPKAAAVAASGGGVRIQQTPTKSLLNAHQKPPNWDKSLLNAHQKPPNWDSRFVTGPGGHFAYLPRSARSGAGSGAGAGSGRPGSGRPGVQVGSGGSGGSGAGAGGSGASGGYSSDARPGNCGAMNPCSPMHYGAADEPADVVSSDGLDEPGQISTAPANPSLITDQSGNIIVTPPASQAGMGEWTDSIAKPGAVPAECTGTNPGGSSSSFPWWLWLLIAGAVIVAANDNGEGRSGGKKRAA